MLGLAEYVVGSRELLTLAQQAELRISQQVTQETTKSQAKRIAQSELSLYYQEFRELLDRNMREIAQNAIDHYASLLGTEPDPELVEAVVQKQYTDKYYGATLTQRLNYNYARLIRAGTNSVIIGPEHAASTLTKVFPHGAHYLIDKRLMLGTASKIENDAARASAVKADIKFLRWTLSHVHQVQDQCDDLATNVDKKVVAYFKDNNFSIDPKGIYFVEDLPLPPHPNCQCEYTIVTQEGPINLGSVSRTFSKVISLLRRLRKR